MFFFRAFICPSDGNVWGYFCSVPMSTTLTCHKKFSASKFEISFVLNIPVLLRPSLIHTNVSTVIQNSSAWVSALQSCSLKQIGGSMRIVALPIEIKPKCHKHTQLYPKSAWINSEWYVRNMKRTHISCYMEGAVVANIVRSQWRSYQCIYVLQSLRQYSSCGFATCTLVRMGV